MGIDRTVLLPHDGAVCHEAEPMALPGRAVRGALLPAGADASGRFFQRGHRWTHRAVAERRGGKETWLGLVLASGSSPACGVERPGGLVSQARLWPSWKPGSVAAPFVGTDMHLSLWKPG